MADGDKTIVRTTITGVHTNEFLGLPPTGRRISVPEVAVVRFEEGKIVEEWGTPDMLGLMQQLGAIPSGF